MKSILTAFVCLLGLLAPVVSSSAQDAFTSSSSDYISGGIFGTTNYHCIIPLGNAAPSVEYISFRNDKAAGNITFYTPGTNNVTQVTNTAAAGTNVLSVVNTNNAYVAGDKLIFQFKSFTPHRYQHLQVASISGYALTLNSNLTWAAAAGDTVWKVNNVAGLIRGGAATNSISANSGAIYNGRVNEPILVLMDSTTTAGLDAVSGRYGR